MCLEGGESGTSRCGGSGEPWRQARDSGVGRGGGVGRGERVGDELLDPGQLPQRRLCVETCDGSTAVADQGRACGVEYRGERLEPSRRGLEPVREWRELARLEREEAFAQEVDPIEWVPGVLGERRLREQLRLELADEQVAVDGVVD